MATDNPIVEYREIQGYPGYRVGDDGSVWSCFPGGNPVGKWRKLKPGIHKRRTPGRTYLYIHLWREGTRKTFLIHRIVLEAFVGQRPDGMECRHKDGNPTNNALTNICWGTHIENTNDTHRLGKFSKKLTEDQVKEIRKRYAMGGVLQRELAAEYGISRMNISSIITRFSWKHID